MDNQSVLEAQAGHLSKRMPDRYKHISEKAARKASDAPSRVGVGLDAANSRQTTESNTFPYKFPYSAIKGLGDADRISLILLVGSGRFERPTPAPEHVSLNPNNYNNLGNLLSLKRQPR